MRDWRLVLTHVLVGGVAMLLLSGSRAGATEPVITAETNWDGITVHVMEVARKGSVLTVKFAAVNSGESPREVAFGFTGKDVCYAVDEESGGKYYVLTDTEGNPVASAKDWMPNSTSGISRTIAPAGTLRVWMKLPAPPPEVKTISLFLNETDPIENVPIRDR